jgi:hypothetical protein
MTDTAVTAATSRSMQKRPSRPVRVAGLVTWSRDEVSMGSTRQPSEHGPNQPFETEEGRRCPLAGPRGAPRQAGRAEASKQSSNSVDERRQVISLVHAYPTGQQLASPWPSGAARPAGSARLSTSGVAPASCATESSNLVLLERRNARTASPAARA